MKRTVIIVSASSDIGRELAKRYASQGVQVIGTYRSASSLGDLKEIKGVQLFHCDLSSKQSIQSFIKKMATLRITWDTFISCAGTEEPIGTFFKCDFDEWSNSVHVNAIEQLRIMHGIYKYRSKRKVSNVVYFAGGGTNNAVPHYSAYTASKIMLIKMCELLDAENKDLNVFIVGPGWVKTKIHYQTIKAPQRAGKNYLKAKEFMKADTAGTSMDDIFHGIEWFVNAGRKVSGGRNFSIVHDQWRGSKSKMMTQRLLKDSNMYKLRRHKNDY